MHTLPNDQEFTRERLWDKWVPAKVDAGPEMETPIGPDIDDAAAADLLFSSMVADFDVPADQEEDLEYNAWLDQFQAAVESCHEDRMAGLRLPLPVYLDREQQIQRTVDRIVDAILHRGSSPDLCPCHACTLCRTDRYTR